MHEFCTYRPDSAGIYDAYPTLEAAQAEAAKLASETGAPFEVARFDDWIADNNRRTLARFPLCEVTADFYDQMHGCLPPMYRTGAAGFFICERVTGTITTQFVACNGRYFGGYVDLADRDTWITRDKIEALPSSAPVEWYPSTQPTECSPQQLGA